MSNNNQDWYDDFEDDIDDDLDEQPQRRSSGEDVVKKLRRAERTQSKRIKELESELTTLRKTTRDFDVKSVLESKGISPKVAAFIPQELDVSSKEFDTWFEEYADIFGGLSPAQSADTGPSVADLATLRQIDSVTAGAYSPDRNEDLYMQLNQAQSAEEILNMIYGAE